MEDERRRGRAGGVREVPQVGGGFVGRDGVVTARVAFDGTRAVNTRTRIRDQGSGEGSNCRSKRVIREKSQVGVRPFPLTADVTECSPSSSC